MKIPSFATLSALLQHSARAHSATTLARHEADASVIAMDETAAAPAQPATQEVVCKRLQQKGRCRNRALCMAKRSCASHARASNGPCTATWAQLQRSEPGQAKIATHSFRVCMKPRSSRATCNGRRSELRLSAS